MSQFRCNACGYGYANQHTYTSCPRCGGHGKAKERKNNKLKTGGSLKAVEQSMTLFFIIDIFNNIYYYNIISN